MKTLHDYVAERCDEFGDCLLWKLGCIKGHPSGRWQGKSVLIRRVLWEQQHGPVPAGKVLRCTCGHAACLNIEHCQPMTYRAIAKIDGAAGKMSGPVRSAKIAAKKRASKQAKITQEDAQAIRASNETLQTWADRLGINIATASKIRNGKIRRDFSNPWMGLGA